MNGTVNHLWTQRVCLIKVRKDLKEEDDDKDGDLVAIIKLYIVRKRNKQDDEHRGKSFWSVHNKIEGCFVFDDVQHKSQKETNDRNRDENSFETNPYCTYSSTSEVLKEWKDDFLRDENNFSCK